MGNRELRESLVGFVVLMGLAVGLVASYAAQELRPAPGYVLKATFNRVDGVTPGGEIRLGGIKIGTIERQDLDDRFRAVLTLRIDSAIRLPADTSAAIHTDGLFGAKFIVLDPGGDERMLQSGESISFTQDSVLVDELLELIIAEGKARRANDKQPGSGSKDAK